MCSLEGGYGSFKRCITLDAQKQGTALTKEIIGLGHNYPPIPAQLGIYDQITLWGYFP